MNRILLIADRKTTIDSLRDSVHEHSCNFLVATNQRMALQIARRHSPDVIILDNTSGRLRGKKLVQSIQRVMDAPLIAIVRDKEEAAAMPVTDCLVKPYTGRQLKTCMQKALEYPRALRVGDLRLDLRSRYVAAPHLRDAHQLTPKLFSLLRVLMVNRNQIVSRRQLMIEVWNTNFLDDTRTLDVHIRWIRQIIEPNPDQPIYLTTIRGQGYCIASPEKHEPRTRKKSKYRMN